MHKQAAYTLIYCLTAYLLTTGCVFGQSSGNVIDIARTQLGVREEGGNNKGKQVSEYLEVTGFSTPAPWCAAFVSWCHVQASIPAINSAWSPAWFPESRTIWKQGRGRPPDSGDVFGIYFRSKKRIAHVGLIETWQNDSRYCITIEGNTNAAGSREGDGVYRKRRLKTQIYKVSRWHH